MGVAEERLVLEFLEHGHGRQMDVDAMTAMMTEDFVMQTNVPTWRPRIGRVAAREELLRQNEMSTGGLPESEVLHVASSDRVVFTERKDVFEVGGRRVTLRTAAVLEVADGKIAAWREYYDSVDLARQLDLDPKLVVEE